MRKIRAYMPLSFFDMLLPFNIELIKGNAMIMRACGAKPSDGSILRSKEFILFGNGIATLIPMAKKLEQLGERGYVLEIEQKRDSRGIAYWDAQIARDKESHIPRWSLECSSYCPSSDDGLHVRKLVGQNGNPGQFIYLVSVV